MAALFCFLAKARRTQRNAKKKKERKPESSQPVNFIIFALSAPLREKKHDPDSYKYAAPTGLEKEIFDLPAFIPDNLFFFVFAVNKSFLINRLYCFSLFKTNPKTAFH